MTTDNSEFLAKLRLRTRVQHIILLAKTLRGRLELGGLAVVPAQPAVPAPDEPKKPPV